MDAILGTRASSEPIVVLENCGVASVEQELLEGNCVIIILVMLYLHCTDMEVERRPSVVNSPTLDEEQLQTDESLGNHCCVVCTTL